jgi:glycerol kinase
MNAILVLDADTTNVKAILVDRRPNILARSSVPVAIQFPKSGRVEQVARKLWIFRAEGFMSRSLHF